MKFDPTQFAQCSPSLGELDEDFACTGQCCLRKVSWLLKLQIFVSLKMEVAFGLKIAWNPLQKLSNN